MTTVQQFFRDFEEASNNFDAARSAAQFSDVFLHADPQGVQAVPKDAFIKSLDKRRAFFDSLGLRTTKLAVIEEIPLNSQYTLAKARVTMYFRRPEGSELSVEQTASYIIKLGETPQVVFYLNDQLLTELLQAHGLLPEA
jgi:hypothetical protein